jgi:putative transcriptional regulator
MKIAAVTSETGQEKTPGYLDGQILVAMPTIQDDRFARTVIYLCAHSSEGAMGIVINKPAQNVRFSDLLEQLEVIPKKLADRPIHIGHIPVLKGGPVETQRGFVLHSADFFIKDSTLSIDGGICLTATLDILKAMARGEGPESAILALGYAGWAPGQLESEIHANGWLNCAADADLIFSGEPETKYAAALRKIGIDPAKLSSDAGHA